MQLITPPKYAIAVMKADGSVDELSRWQLRKYIQRCARDKLLLQNKSLRRELKELRNTIPNKGDRLSCWRSCGRVHILGGDERVKGLNI